MKTKLTLSVDVDLARLAHEQARARKTSVSNMFIEFINQERLNNEKASVDNIGMVGSLKAYGINDSKQAVRTGYAKKYSR